MRKVKVPFCGTLLYMKTLKVDHQTAQQIVKGEKIATWRVNDDKDLHVNDAVLIIDKVSPLEPDSWKVIGEAHITEILEKRIGGITAQDLAVYKEYSTKENILKASQNFYGPSVDERTPIKFLTFTFNPQQPRPLAKGDVKKSTVITEVKLYADGGSRGNPGPSASGYVLMDMNDTVIVENGLYLGVTTNNQAEYQALKIGLEEALKRGVQVVHIYMDSLLVVNQMKSIYKVKNRDLLPIHDGVRKLLPHFKKATFTHVPRELNKLADGVVNNILDTAAQEEEV